MSSNDAEKYQKFLHFSYFSDKQDSKARNLKKNVCSNVFSSIEAEILTEIFTDSIKSVVTEKNELERLL